MSEPAESLYATYRRAVLNRNDEEALGILRSIVRANPSDANAAAELERLDAKVLAARLRHLDGSVEGGDARLVVAEVEAIETFGFKARPEGDGWRKAQTIRCEVLVADIAGLKTQSRWSDALVKIDLIHRLQKKFKLELPAGKQLEGLEAWARGEKEKDAQERAFQALLSELQVRIQKSEEKDTSARYVELPELRDDYEGLHKVWRSLTDFSRPIPPEAMAAFKKRSALLEAEIYRRNAIQRRIIVAAGVTVLIVVAAIAWAGARAMRAHNFARELRAAIAQRQVHTAENLIADGHNKNIGSADLLADAGTFVERENLLLTNFESALAELPREFPDHPNAAGLDAVADEFSLARNALNALAPDLKIENEPRVAAFEQNWQNYLAQSSGAVNDLLAQWIASAEKECDALDYNAPLAKTRNQLAALSDLVQKISDNAAGFGKNLQLRSDLLARLATVRDKAAGYQAELDKVDGGLAAIQRARTIGEFSQGINLIASSEFLSASAVAGAAAIQSLDVNEETTLRYLLNATNASTWAYIQKQQAADFIPEAVMPAERQILRNLAKDPTVSANHLHYHFWLDSQGENFIEWITAGPLDTSTGWKTISAWTVSPAAGSAVFSDHEYGYFDGQYKLTPTEPILHVNQSGSSDETAAFHSIGLEKVLAGDNAYSKPLLEVLDSLKNSEDGSPLFRAYLFWHLTDLMNLQPDAWGVSFCPALVADEGRLGTIVNGDLNDGDWFVPSKVSAYGKPLEQFFAGARAVIYQKQANGLLALAQAVSKNGLRYAGYWGMDGQPHLIGATVPQEFWAYSVALKEPILLTTLELEHGVYADSASTLQATVKRSRPLRDRAPVMPLSPLFTTALSRKEYMANAGVNPDDPSFKNALPPFFQNPTR